MGQDKRERTRGQWSNQLIRMATGASLVSALLLVAGFTYGTYAALGGQMNGSGSGTPGAVNSSAGVASGAANGSPNGASGGSGSAGGGGGSGTGSTSATSVKKTVHLVALGDSLTHGLGDASGLGYVGDVSAQFRQQGLQVIQSNMGIDGLTSTGLLKQIEQPGVQNLIQSANLILISIGGNDLNDAAGLPNIDTKRIAVAEKQFDSNIHTILTRIRTLNPSATVALIGLYNPYGNVTATVRQTDAIVQTWDGQEEAIAATFPGIVVVQTFDLFQLHPTQFLYVDHFHPNQAGYQRIAARVWQDIQGN